LDSAECELLRCLCEWLQDFKFCRRVGKESVEKFCIVLSVKC